MARKRSVFAHFRLAGISVILGVVLVGAVFYGAIHSHFLGLVISRTLGPYSDTLAEYGFASSDPEIWPKMAVQHKVAIDFRSADGKLIVYDANGQSVALGPRFPSQLNRGLIRAHRISEDGREVTFYFSLWTFREQNHYFLIGLVFMVVAVVGMAFWFLQRQLRPLTWLRIGVDAVARGDFKTRVPVVRNDEIGEVAEAFNLMTSRVGEMIDDRERLLIDVSHELRSPIARMKVGLEFMPEGAKRDGLSRDLNEMTNLIAVLLEREAMRSRTDRFEGEKLDLQAFTRDVVAGFVGQTPGVEFVSDEAVTIHADPTLLKMLIQNLVGNAIKFSLPDSTPVAVKLENADDTVSLRVSDDGIGLPAGNEEKLFEPFVKGDRSRGHRVGYGIGLNLCQRIVQLHDGTIKLVRRDPRGAEAIVTLRRSRSPNTTTP